MYDGSQASFGLDDHIRNPHLAAESGEEDDKLDRIDIIGNNDKVGLLGFNKGNDVVQAVLDEERLLGLLILGFLVGSSGSSDGVKTSFLLLLGLRPVLVKELE